MMKVTVWRLLPDSCFSKIMLCCCLKRKSDCEGEVTPSDDVIGAQSYNALAASNNKIIRLSLQ